MKCECEHENHFGGRLLNDPPRHVYGADFSPGFTKLVRTECGTFRVCLDCASHCEGYNKA